MACAWLVSQQPRGSLAVPAGGLLPGGVRPVRDMLIAEGFGVERYVVSQSGSTLPRWAAIDFQTARRTPQSHQVVGGGWPFITLVARTSSKMSTANPPQRLWQDGWLVKNASALDPFTSRIVPYRPYLPGLIANTAFWGVVILLVMMVLRQATAERRRREGRCCACGYDLRGNATTRRCPECGEVTEPV